MSDLAFTYERLCKESSTKINSRVISFLRTIDQKQKHQNIPLIISWDLSNTMLGIKGGRIILQLIAEKLPLLTTLNLSGNNLPSAFTKYLLETFVNHPNITSIDLSENDLRLGGPELIELLKRNRNIVELGIHGTYFRTLFVRLMEIQLQKNRSKKTQKIVKTVGNISASRETSGSGSWAGAAASREKSDSRENVMSQSETCSTGVQSLSPSVSPPLRSSHYNESIEKIKVSGLDDSAISNSRSSEGDSGSWLPGGQQYSFHDEDTFPLSGAGGETDRMRDIHIGVEDEIKGSTDRANNFNRGSHSFSPILRRCTVAAEVFTERELEIYDIPHYEKSENDALWLLCVLEKHDLFSHLEDYELTVAVQAMEEIPHHNGHELFDIGDDDIDLFYIVAQGEVELYNKNGEVTRRLKRGNCLNDLMLLYHEKITERAVCVQETRLFTIDRPTYKVILARASKKKRAMYEGFLNTVGFLKAARLSKEELLQLADSLKSVNFAPGETLIHYGETGEVFYIIVEGAVEVLGRDDDQKTVKVCEFTTGDCVGELEFLNQHKCVADVKSIDFVRAAKMNRTHFEMVMGPVREVLARTASESSVYSYYRHQLEKIERGTTPDLQ